MRAACALMTLALATTGANLASIAPQSPETISITTARPEQQPGDLVVLTIVVPERTEDVRVQAAGRAVPAYAVAGQTWQALVGLDIDTRPGREPVVVEARGPGGGAVQRASQPLVIRPRKFPTRTLTVDPAFVNPPPEMEGRILREARHLEELWAASSPERLWSGPFVKPVAAMASGRFGARSIFNGVPRSPHAGEDFPSPTGAPIVAPNAGRVVLAGDLYFAGNTVVIDHGFGMFSLLEHLSAFAVKEGDAIRTGQRIGLVGATGRVTGPHLHWAVRLNGARVDPRSVLESVGR